MERVHRRVTLAVSWGCYFSRDPVPIWRRTRTEPIFRMRTLLTVVIVLLGAAALPTHAQAPAAGENPYEGRVGVADQSAASRDQALREALGQVVARVSGPSAPASAAGIIARAPQLVSRYGFQRGADDQLELVAAFDRPALDQQLRSLGLPVWGYTAAPAEDVVLLISGLRDAQGYSRAMSAVRAVPGVRAVAVASAEADRLHLTVRAEGGASRVGPALLASRQFVQEQTAEGPSLRLLP